MDHEGTAVARHYGMPGIAARLLAELEARGGDPSRVTAADLRGMDQLHGGGLAATESLAALAGIAPGWRVLDAGAGLGGTARWLAEVHGAEVEAIDLTPEFVEAGEALNRLCGLDGRVRIRAGSVTALPYPHSSFDAVWSHYVAMNVADKARLASEAFRVLRPGGVLAFAMLAQGPAGEPRFPLPWAREPGASFLATVEEMAATLERAGFALEEVRSPPAGAPPRGGGDEGLAPKTAAMGDDMAQREDNARRSVAEGRLRPMMARARRPA